MVPCRNEAAYINACLQSIIDNDFPKELLEVLVVDGMSTDGTRAAAEKMAAANPFIKILDNPEKLTPAALNEGIRRARGRYIIILGSHSRIREDFISKNMEWIKRSDADCVGGVLSTMPASGKLLAGAIAAAMSSPFGVGNSSFRTGAGKPLYVDTVPFGCYRKEVFERIGYFDPELARNQDDEFNLRLKKSGGRLLLVPEIVSYYYSRDSLAKLWRMYYQYGYFKALVAKKLGKVMTVRQLVPPLFVAGLVLSALAGLLAHTTAPLALIGVPYPAASVGFSIYTAFIRGVRFLPALPAVFAAIHFSYGLGYLRGVISLIGKRRPRAVDVPLTR